MFTDLGLTINDILTTADACSQRGGVCFLLFKDKPSANITTAPFPVV